MKIKKLIVRNYKLFDDLELDFTDKKSEILDTIVLAGLNGSGKTTLLELIELLLNGTLLEENLQKNTYIQLQLLTNQPFSEINTLFKTIPDADKSNLSLQWFSERQTIIIFDFLNDKPKKSLENQFINGLMNFALFIGHYKYLGELGIFLFANDKRKIDFNAVNMRCTSFNRDNLKIQKNILEAIQKQVFANPDTPPRQVFTRQIAELNQIFSQLNLYSKLKQINEKELIFESINGQPIYFEQLSSGEKTLYYMGFMLQPLHLNHTIIMVDQPEDTLHPTWQQQITAFFKNIGTNNQVILATHSPQVIASVHPESVFVLGIEGEKRKIKAFNMATEHKNSYGVDANRILSEIMGTPIRSFEAQQRINAVNNQLKEMELNPAPSSLVILENQIDTLAIDFGKQDAAVMRLRNELRLLKRNVELRK
ncbi:MAG: hypothetical protein RLZZ628_1733 [Bacteroidota bacterium]|jgi:predicted ATP-binding protein involved in virulence